MHQKPPIMMLLLLLSGAGALAQEAGSAQVRGRLIRELSQEPAPEVQLIFPRLKLLTTSSGEGYFNFSQVPFGPQYLVVSGGHVRPDTIQIMVDKAVVDLGVISVQAGDAGMPVQSLQIPQIAMEENDAGPEDEGVRAQNVSGLLAAGRDPFLNAAAFVFGPYRFQARGYDRNQQLVLINGMPMNDVETGGAYWSQWGGLNDAFRARSNTYGLQPSEYAFGGINGTVFFDATALNQRKQTRITYSRSNRQYSNRLMLTHSSGLQANGWAYSVSLSKRWAQEGYVPGTFYDGYSYYAGISRKWKQHQLSLTSFGAPTRRGKQAPAIQEAYDIAGTNYYNPNWGYQTLDGERVKRNARVNNSFQPAAILNYEYAPGLNTRWNTAIGYQFGEVENSSLDWYNARDPRPDYYRNLPSYYLYELQNPLAAAAVREDLINNPEELQVNWDRLYMANRMNRDTIRDANGIIGNQVSGNRSAYIIGADVDRVQKWILNTQVSHVRNSHVTLYGGLTYINQRTESFRRVLDLLGGDFYVNYNQFAARQFVGDPIFLQNDLNNPNRLLYEGDRYNYNYINHFHKGWAWGQAAFSYNRVDFFIAGQAGFNTFKREGLYRNGIFPNNSFGKGETLRFLTFGAKGGVTYKISGRHYLFAHVGISQDAPTVDNTYISPRTRSYVIDHPQAQQAYSAEGGYLMRAPNMSVRLVGYVTDIKHATSIKRFYNESAGFETFVNYVMTGLDMRFTGAELALEYKLSPSLTLTGVAALGQAFYTSRPNVKLYKDLDTSNAFLERTVYLKDYYLSVGPQSAYTLGLNYRSKRYWYASANLNYFDRNYIEAAPDRRTEEAIDMLEPGSALWQEILSQEKLPAAFSVDVFAGKSFLLSRLSRAIPRNVFLYLNVGINNILDNREIRTGGFEQLRYDFAGNRAGAFPPKYFYGYGRNYFLNLSLRF